MLKLIQKRIVYVFSILFLGNSFFDKKKIPTFFSIPEGDGDADKKEKVEDVENAEPVAS